MFSPPIYISKLFENVLVIWLAAKFAPLAKQLTDNVQTIVAELAAVQGAPADIGGYYLPDVAKLDAMMRPSATLNKALASVK